MTAPKLRFREFYNDWLANNLGEVCSHFQSGKSITSKNINDSHGFPVYGGNGLRGFTDTFTHEGKFVLVGRQGALCGNVNLVDGINYISEHAIAIQANTDNSTDLLAYWLDKMKLNRFSEASAQPGLAVNKLVKFKIILPALKEQTKIASFLSAVDDKITQLTQEHELLSEYKKGMMQQLFSQNPRFKADDGSDFENWKETTFSQIFNFHMTNSCSREKLSEQGEVMNIHYGDIHTKFSTLFDASKELVPFLKDKADCLKIKEDQFLQVGDLVIADASEDYKDIGKSIEIVNMENNKVVAGLHTYIARPSHPHALGFYGYMMQTNKVRKQIQVLATGISVLGISKTNLGKLIIELPSLDEQAKIANFLSAIDQKIENVATQIDQAKVWKKGLLQQMFV